ncbi:hypothetical protein U9M48_036130 [Paspalum notatum var. saurae]|uniref:Retrotransposon gag domain-containing protein n=1 Tax=Paspalum notatum var. saurae TaxID=547442 RepID=A0AAQ3UGK6_PASNO
MPNGGVGASPPPRRPTVAMKIDLRTSTRWTTQVHTDPLLFTNKCESFFHQQRILEKKVWMATFNLDGPAQQWYMRLQREEGTPSWRRFAELLNVRFGPPIRANPLGELAALRCTGSVMDYGNTSWSSSLVPGPSPKDSMFSCSLWASKSPSASTFSCRILCP